MKRYSASRIPALLAGLLLAACSSLPPSSPSPTGRSTTTTAPGEPTKPSSQQQVDAARQAEFDRNLAAWRGAPLQELLAKLGKPTSVHPQRDGSSIYVYAKSAKLAGDAGPVDFRCVVRYQVEGRTQRVSGLEIEGC
ncbi:hypothetical protein [Pelomonas sp. SE-A7]|uniref:hypothetical protein n=1 Tax=Pelomonas sp. SE-A7 TaxID=3054953 RepID=UPI00259CECAD|nr:hypothetical protein [Pelomonas sp. SE-A7]MDM4766631.1 hypothetical protein [Pelomonas sp. SE-A7]